MITLESRSASLVLVVSLAGVGGQHLSAETPVTSAPAGYWKPMPRAPSPRSLHQAFWTGSAMLVLGGTAPCSQRLQRFDPATSEWSTPDLTGAPLYASAVWSGAELLVFGWAGMCGSSPAPASGRYDPVLDRWTRMADGPAFRSGESLVWTGDEVLLFGGSTVDQASHVTYSAEGARYDPRSDTWRPMSSLNAPEPRARHAAVWTGTKMFVWGGIDGMGNDSVSVAESGGLYDPATDRWTRLSTIDAPRVTYGSTASLVNGRVLVWSGALGRSFPPGRVAGGIHDPDTDSWTPLTTAPNWPPRGSFSDSGWGHTAIVAGSTVVVWDGHGAPSGGVFDPESRAWQDLAIQGAPEGRWYHTAVWTGLQMIVFGGYGFPSFQDLDSGGIWSPVPFGRRGTPGQWIDDPGPDQR